MLKTFYWSVRRETWENRWIFVVPSIGALLLVAALITRRIAWREWPVEGETLGHWCAIVAAALSMLSIAVGLFYLTDALHGERRDRSILFWKSMPVSDLVTVLAKAFIPLAVIPATTFVIVVATQLVMVVTGGEFPSELPRMTLELLLGLMLMALWQAPLQAWVLLISGVARRAVLAIAVLLPVAAGVLERLVFGTRYISTVLMDRLTLGVYDGGIGSNPHHLIAPSVVGLATNPALWLGLPVAALLLAASIYLRRYRQPL